MFVTGASGFARALCWCLSLIGSSFLSPDNYLALPLNVAPSHLAHWLNLRPRGRNSRQQVGVWRWDGLARLLRRPSTKLGTERSSRPQVALVPAWAPPNEPSRATHQFMGSVCGSLARARAVESARGSACHRLSRSCTSLQAEKWDAILAGHYEQTIERQREDWVCHRAANARARATTANAKAAKFLQARQRAGQEVGRASDNWRERRPSATTSLPWHSSERSRAPVRGWPARPSPRNRGSAARQTPWHWPRPTAATA